MGEQLSHKELERHVILKRVLATDFTEIKAAALLSIKRQIRNLLTAYRARGAKGLISKQHGIRTLCLRFLEV